MKTSPNTSIPQWIHQAIHLQSWSIDISNKERVNVHPKRPVQCAAQFWDQKHEVVDKFILQLNQSRYIYEVMMKLSNIIAQRQGHLEIGSSGKKWTLRYSITSGTMPSNHNMNSSSGTSLFVKCVQSVQWTSPMDSTVTKHFNSRWAFYHLHQWSWIQLPSSSTHRHYCCCCPSQIPL